MIKCPISLKQRKFSSVKQNPRLKKTAPRIDLANYRGTTLMNCSGQL